MERGYYVYSSGGKFVELPLIGHITTRIDSAGISYGVPESHEKQFFEGSFFMVDPLERAYEILNLDTAVFIAKRDITYEFMDDGRTKISDSYCDLGVLLPKTKEFKKLFSFCGPVARHDRGFECYARKRKRIMARALKKEGISWQEYWKAQKSLCCFDHINQRLKQHISRYPDPKPQRVHGIEQHIGHLEGCYARNAGLTPRADIPKSELEAIALKIKIKK